MLFFLNLDGTVTRSDTDHVYQGQNKVANVELFTLISPAQAAIQVAFTLPNGLTTAYLPMSYVGAYSVDESNQKQVHRWKLAVPYNVTEVEGQVGVSFNVLLNDGTSGQAQETINQTTYTSSFLVEYSALPIPPTTATEDELGQLLDLLDQYYAQNASLAAKQPFVVGTVKTNTLGANQQASVAVEQSTTPDSKGNYPTNFTFGIPQGIQGTQGEVGKTPDVLAVAEVNNTVGTPSVEVEKSGTKENPVFNFKFSNIKGQKGDSGIGDAKLSNTPGTSETDGYTQNTVNGIVQNPNLLINPNFAINQRGQTSYVGTVYSVDRWRNSYGTLELQSNGEIKHTSSNTWQGVAQYIENPSRLAGKTVTISAMGRVEGATAFRIYLYYQIGDNARVTVCQASTTSTTNTIISASGTLPEDITDNDKLYFILYNATANTSFYCKWAKLEIGSVATEFSPPSIAEELAKCQRYYENVYASDMWGAVSGTNYAIANCIFKTPKRTTPTLLIKNPMTIRYGGTNYTQTTQGTASSYRNNNSAVITFGNFSGLTVGQYWWSNERELLVCAIDAEM